MRLFILASLVAFHVATSDPLFVVLTAIVGLGVVLTGTSYLKERNKTR